MGIALPILVLAKQPLVAAGYGEDQYRRHRTLWIAVTMLVFVAHSFWLYTVLAGILLALASTRDRMPLSLYFVVLFAAPHFTMLLPGIGPIQNLFYFTHIRMLNLAILLPLALMVRRTQQGVPHSVRLPDLAVLGYLAVMLIAHARNDSITMMMRLVFYLFVDIGLPYYVASRAITRMEHFRQVAGGFVLATLIMALIAVFETFKGWLLYESLRVPLRSPVEVFAYILRSEGGPLRAVASTTYPIILGYVMTVGLGLYAFLAHGLEPRWKSRLAFLGLVAGLIASLSRGPWVAAALMLLVLVVLGPGKSKRLATAIGFGGIVVTGLMASPWADALMSLLPFVGDVQSENVDYRARLFDVSLLVLAQKPLLGDLNFMANPLMEQMRQGQGVIDIVNTYVQVALPYGLVGLFLFSASLLLPMHAVWRARRTLAEDAVEDERLGRTLLAIMLAILVTIATASTIGAIGPIYWLMAGLCVAYARMLHPLPAQARRDLKTPLRQRMSTKRSDKETLPRAPGSGSADAR